MRERKREREREREALQGFLPLYSTSPGLAEQTDGDDAAPLRRTALLPWKLRCDGEVIVQCDWSGRSGAPGAGQRGRGREEPERRGERRGEGEGLTRREREREGCMLDERMWFPVFF